ncbi:hypothetical protein BD31_I1867 [Candidatus Nitrosopumilus salaria BD31]|uniref:Uncharacterized protein n=1 Tax=Candidatus Nitrosopumilus salarius BD31 TaxID=859350 RepID=I3D0K1_9ARCH|nr:hypothetical protein BD31_I1867 [Candidatus Nitrosopumilus salaria BD31]
MKCNYEVFGFQISRVQFQKPLSRWAPTLFEIIIYMFRNIILLTTFETLPYEFFIFD